MCTMCDGESCSFASEAHLHRVVNLSSFTGHPHKPPGIQLLISSQEQQRQQGLIHLFKGFSRGV